MHECLNYFFRLSDRIIKCYDPVKVFYYNYWLYICSGFWKYESTKRWKTNFYKCYQISITLFYAASMALFVVDAIIVRKDLNKLSFNMSSSVLVFMKTTQIALLFHTWENIVDMNDKLDNHLYLDTVGCSDSDKYIFKEKARKTLLITVAFYSLLAIGLPLRVIADTALDTRAYLIPIPFKDKLEPFYAYLYAQQVFASFHFMASTLAFDLLEFTFILRFMGHYDVLEKNISKIKSLYPRTKYDMYVRGVVRNFSDTYSRPLLIQVCGLLILIGILILQLLFLSNELLSPLFMQQIIYAVTAIMNIFYLSSCGSELTSKSMSIANTLYDTPWYDMSISNRKTVRLILQSLMKGPKLKGGDIINIDRPMCVKFFQFSYNMVTLLKKRM